MFTCVGRHRGLSLKGQRTPYDERVMRHSGRFVDMWPLHPQQDSLVTFIPLKDITSTPCVCPVCLVTSVRVKLQTRLTFIWAAFCRHQSLFGAVFCEDCRFMAVIPSRQMRHLLRQPISRCIQFYANEKADLTAFRKVVSRYQGVWTASIKPGFFILVQLLCTVLSVFIFLQDTRGWAKAEKGGAASDQSRSP